MRHSRFLVPTVALALSVGLTGCFDTRGSRRPVDAGPGRQDAGIILLGDSGRDVERCGDGACSSSESCSSCETDCGRCPTSTCGDGTCSSSESCSSCETDCGRCPTSTCGDGTCSSSESCSSCEIDCGRCGGGCRSYPIPPYPGVACSSATRSCAEGCADGACVDGCLMSDPSADCYGCATQNTVSCIIAAGCEAEWDCYNTCYEDAGCTSASSCSACTSERSAWDRCVELYGDGCGGEWVSCLP